MRDTADVTGGLPIPIELGKGQEEEDRLVVNHGRLGGIFEMPATPTGIKREWYVCISPLLFKMWIINHYRRRQYK
jgi:hypothetical protein